LDKYAGWATEDRAVGQRLLPECVGQATEQEKETWTEPSEFCVCVCVCVCVCERERERERERESEGGRKRVMCVVSRGLPSSPQLSNNQIRWTKKPPEAGVSLSHKPLA
jgi:hypothetical protein